MLSRIVQGAVLGLTLVTAIACKESGPTSPTQLDQQIVLAPGQTMPVGELRVRFERVRGDSRCPADALCITGGDAVVQITVLDAGASREYELHTGDMKPVTHGATTIALVQLVPYPFSARPIEPDEYRATLRLTRD
jgi:hypothetical protein